MSILSIMLDGSNIQCIIDPSEEMQLEAIKQDERSIRYIKKTIRKSKDRGC